LQHYFWYKRLEITQMFTSKRCVTLTVYSQNGKLIGCEENEEAPSNWFRKESRIYYNSPKSKMQDSTHNMILSVKERKIQLDMTLCFNWCKETTRRTHKELIFCVYLKGRVRWEREDLCLWQYFTYGNTDSMKNYEWGKHGFAVYILLFLIFEYFVIYNEKKR
jgi:hypothetical protein